MYISVSSPVLSVVAAALTRALFPFSYCFFLTVIEGRYLGMIVKDRKHSLQVRVKNVIYKSTASPRRLKVGRELIILTDQPESVCGGCPNLHAMNTTYVMAGFSRGSQLVYRVNQGIALQTERSYASRIAKWLRKLYKST